jgi:hypothetical protein
MQYYGCRAKILCSFVWFICGKWWSIRVRRLNVYVVVYFTNVARGGVKYRVQVKITSLL